MRRRTAGNKRRVNPCVERDEAPPTLHRECQEMEIGEIPGCREHREQPNVRERKIIVPELVTGRRSQGIQKTSRLRGRARAARVATRAQDAEEGVFRQWTGGPPFDRRRFLKEAERGDSVGVIGVPECDQDVGVEELDHDEPEAIAITLASSSSY